MRRDLVAIVASIAVARGLAHADDPPAPDTAVDDEPHELIEVTSSTPVTPGAISLDAGVARSTPGALGEPLRALALLPGVTSSLAASGYPIIRGTLPGESRFTFDDIELPMLYHFVLGTQVIHPSFIGGLELRAGGYGAEQGQLIGGLVTMTPASPDGTRTELRANPVEIGAYRFQALSKATSIAAAGRVGTLTLAKIYKPGIDLYYVDQQTRIVHRLGNGDQLTLTSLGAFDYYGRTDVGFKLQSDLLAFHRLDGRWTRARGGSKLRAGIQTQFDTLRSRLIYETPMVGPAPFPRREGGASYGVRGYADGRWSLAPWLAVRGGLEARHRTLVNGKAPFDLTFEADPYLGLSKQVDAGGAWAALDLRVANLTITPGIRSDVYRAQLYGASVRHLTVDPRFAIQADLPRGARAETSVGMYSAPPQVSLFRRFTVIGPLPMTDGVGSNAGMNRAIQAEAALRTPLGAGLEGRFAAYYRNTRRAVDFAVVDHTFHQPELCRDFAAPYRDLDTRAIGAEVMLRRELARSVTGWLSYSLAKIDRDFGFVQLPGDYDQRHTLNATLQWRRGRWRLGTTGHFHTSRAIEYPEPNDCGGGGTITSLDVLRRPPPYARLDLRAERAYQFATWRMNLYVEMQNASLTSEIVDYETDPLSTRVIEHKVFLPLALIGVEAVL